MRLPIIWVVAASIVLLSACAAGHRQPAVDSMQTDLSPGACRSEIDRNDPNETPYMVCPGVEGYALIVRRVEAGRLSIDVQDAARHVFPLQYDEVVTRHMSTLGDKAEWRVVSRDGRRVPIALIVRVEAREDNANPEKVTGTYFAVAKITPDTACVTDRIPEGARTEAGIRAAADSARDRPCAPPQPRTGDDGAALH